MNRTVKPEVAAATVGSIPKSKNSGFKTIPPPNPKYPAMNPPIIDYLESLFEISSVTIKSSSVLNLNFSLISLTLFNLLIQI